MSAMVVSIAVVHTVLAVWLTAWLVRRVRRARVRHASNAERPVPIVASLKLPKRGWGGRWRHGMLVLDQHQRRYWRPQVARIGRQRELLRLVWHDKRQQTTRERALFTPTMLIYECSELGATFLLAIRADESAVFENAVPRESAC